MTRRPAMLSGLAVLLVLLSGQVISAWYGRPASRPTTVSNIGASAGRQTPTPTPPGDAADDGRPGAAPIGQPDGGTLAALGVKRVTGSGSVALTFDDGPHPHYTPRVLALLRANGVRAVFCVVGTQVRRHPQLVAQIARDGHTLCNHSWHHEVELGSWPARKIKENLLRTSAEIQRAAPGAKIPYFRQPGGKWTRTGVRVVRELGMVPLGWTVDPRDWTKPSVRAIETRVLSQTRPGSIVLLHDAGGERDATIAACRKFIPALKRRYRLTPLR